MATLSKKENKSYTVQLSPGENKKRPKITLGKCTLKHANKSKRCIEGLVRGDITDEAREWIDTLPDGLRIRLEKLGLI